MNFRAFTKHQAFKPALGAVLTVVCGLLLWGTPLGDAWVNASYDYSFRFGARPATNKVVLILMDNEALDHFGQARDQPWDRALHAKLLNKLANEGCPLVVMDTFFRQHGEPAADDALAKAMQRLPRVVLMAELVGGEHPALHSVRPVLPAELFLSAANNNWGVAWLDPDLDLIVRKHWPFIAAGPEFYSLPWTAAKLVKPGLGKVPQEQWLRYYGPKGAWVSLSYPYAFEQPSNYFRDKFVFIGNQPKTSVPGDEKDEFRTPYTRWTGESAGGVEILATSFLNLLNHDWLRRANPWVEASVLVITGIILGSGLFRMRWVMALGIAAAAGLAITIGAVWLNYFTHYWFPWLVIAGGQVPCALLYQIILSYRGPALSDYDFYHRFGSGAYGEVWLVRSSIGQWQALKKVLPISGLADPCHREFRGIKQYKPISEGHSPELLRVELISRPKRDGSFFYVMELGDALTPAWEKNPATYHPRDLRLECAQNEHNRLLPRECVRIGIDLAEALVLLHGHGLVHRDIKPSNVIFVRSRAKLADIGLIIQIPQPGEEVTQVFTKEYVARGESVGTVAADIYALGKLLFVISTGRHPINEWPDAGTTLIESEAWSDLKGLNKIICKACRPLCQPGQAESEPRYASAAEMLADLRQVQKEFAEEQTRKI